MSDKTCKTCKHWHSEPTADFPSMHECLNPKLSAMNGGDDGLFNLGYELGPTCTGPDFGCIHWEQK